MGKHHEAKKEPKRKSAMTIKERRAAKKAKKAESAGHRAVMPETRTRDEPS